MTTVQDILRNNLRCKTVCLVDEEGNLLDRAAGKTVISPAWHSAPVENIYVGGDTLIIVTSL